jgi:ATP-dependent Clp protease ATP-binding subunit ClpA
MPTSLIPSQPTNKCSFTGNRVEAAWQALRCAAPVAHPYPFEMFSEESRQILVGAQGQAEHAGSSYIGTEHMLLAMLQMESSAAYKILTKLGISSDVFASNVTAAVGAVKLRRGRRLVPTMAVKRTVEVAFGEADRMNGKVVETAHLLMGLALQGEGVAAVVLGDMGVTAERIVAEVESDLGVPLSGRGKLPASSPPWTTNLPEPPVIAGLRDRLASVRFSLKHAVEAGDTEHALKLRSEENRLDIELGRARRRWLSSLG